MKKLLFSLLAGLTISAASAQLNMTLLDQLDYAQSLNDVWGWVDPDDGTEYALVGTRTGVSIVSLANPTNIVEVAFAEGASSTWRDIKTWGNYAYVTNESSGGLMVINLTGAPNNITWTNWAPTIPGLGTLNSGHNLYIDEFGYCYLAGTNLNGGGVIIVDVFTTPGSPQYVAKAPAVYAHDVYVRNNLMFASQIYQGTAGIYSVANKSNITLLAAQPTPSNFTHNIWLNDDGTVMFTTDERANAPIGAYDISNLNNIVKLDEFRPVATLGLSVIPHNVHVWNNWLIISYYSDGGIIVDASRPSNLIEVGNWDTFLGGNGGYNGAWGAYPFLPSGNVLLTDIGDGLFHCGANYVRACWLEGTVTDALSGLPINNVNVQVLSPQPNIGTTNSNGKYETGQAIPGVFDVVFTANGYHPKTVSVTLENGELTIVNVQLSPIINFTVSGKTITASDGTPIPGAAVRIKGPTGEYASTSGVNGNFSLTDVVDGTYTLYAGSWGYLHKVIENFVVDNNLPASTVITLDKGYQDDFILDLGWAATNTAPRGLWERGVPIETLSDGKVANPGADIGTDIGDECYVTGNGGGGAGTDDVDSGVVTLTSPPMDLTGYNNPTLSYYTWFFNEGAGTPPNDFFEIRISNGADEVVLESITQSGSEWRPQSQFNLAGVITLTDNMRVVFEASDLPGTGHIVEAAVDAFRVTDSALPVSQFEASVTEGCAPMEVHFTDLSTGNPSSWQWNFPGGTPGSSTAQNPVVVYNTPGTYNVQLTAGGSSPVTLTQFIKVKATPTADFTFSIVNGQATFTNGSQNTTIYGWNFGDNTSSSEANPVHTYTSNGSYEVTLEAAGPCGLAVITKTVIVSGLTAVIDLDETSYALTAKPNPFHQELLIDYELSGNFNDASLLVFNVLGKQVAQAALDAKTGTIALNDGLQQSGVYFVRLMVDGKIGKALRVVKM